MITNVFNIDDNAVLPEDMPQTTYSKKKHEWIKANIKKHEEQIFLVITVRFSYHFLSVEIR